MICKTDGDGAHKSRGINMKLSIIFEEKPGKWGFRGDPYFWDHLKELAKNMDMISPDELERWIKEEYFSLSGSASGVTTDNMGYTKNIIMKVEFKDGSTWENKSAEIWRYYNTKDLKIN